jgi:KDO2-lipid IV(A) lauroyltransferase
MNFREKVKGWGRAAGRYALFTARGLIRRMPLFVFVWFKRIFIAVGRPLINKKKKLAIENLRLAFGQEKSEEEIREIAQNCFDNFGIEMVDLLYFIDRPEKMKENVRIKGKENLDAALKAGNGAILISAHFGNFIMLYLSMVQEGYPTNIIMRRTRDEEFERYISDFRDEHGLKTIYDLPPRKCVQDCIRALRGNELLFIMLDQHYGSAGRVYVDFFGRKSATATGPLVFANRTKSPILPAFIIREEDGRHTIMIDPPVELEQSGIEENSLVTGVAKLTKIIEEYVRRYPAQWGGWMHNRWKTKFS